MSGNNLELIIRAKAMLGEASQQISQFTGEIQQQTDQATKASKLSFQDYATAATVAAGAVAGIAAGVSALGARGADINDLRGNFGQLTSAIGIDSVGALNALRESFAGTVSDAELMKMANQAMAAGLKPTQEELTRLADAARILADRTGTDATTAFHTLAEAMATGRTRGAELLVGTIDNAKAVQDYAEKLGVEASKLSEADKAKAAAIAMDERLKAVIAESGRATSDFGDQVAASKVKLTNFVDGISEWVASSPAIGQWSSVITAASGAVSLVSAAMGPVSSGIKVLLPLLGSGGLVSAFSSVATAISSTVVPLFMTTLPAAFAAITPFLLPAGAIIAGAVALYAAFKHWDDIKRIAQGVYTGVKTYLVDQFAAIVNSIKQKIEAVTGFFSTMYDKVVGHSFVPDMVNEIGVEFGRLDGVMVTPTFTATGRVESAFSGLFTNLQARMPGWLGGLFGPGGAFSTFNNQLDGFMGRMTGKLQGMIGGLFGQSGSSGGMFGSLLQQGLGMFLGPAGPLAGLVSQGIGMLGDLAVKGLQKVGGFFKGLFGGVSEQEKEGRKVADDFRRSLELTAAQADEARIAAEGVWKGNEIGAKTVIALRDAYIAAGRSQEEALDVADRLFKAEKQGGEAVRRVIEEITAVTRQARNAQIDMTSAAIYGFDAASDQANGFLNHLQVIRDEMGRPIVIPIEYQEGSRPSGGGSSSGGNSAAERAQRATEANRGGQGDTSEANREERQAVSREKIQARMAVDEAYRKMAESFFASNPGDWDRFYNMHGAASGGVYSKPAMRVIAERSPEIVGDSNTIVSALAQAMQRVGFAGKAGGGGDVHFHVETPIATIDTVRQMVYAELGPLFLDWLDNNKNGSRTRMQTILGMKVA